jgi:hypothetical protein
MLSFALIAATLIMVTQMMPVLKWRRGVKTGINKLMTSGRNIVEITDRGFLYSQETGEYFENWSSVKSYRIEPGYIFIVASENYIFPNGIMNKEDYEYLMDVLKRFVKNGL